MNKKNLSGKKVALFVNGTIEKENLLAQKLLPYDIYIAVDGGLSHCKKMKKKPYLLIGDLDSVPLNWQSDFPNIPTLTFSSHKDETDLELALQWTFAQNPDLVTVFAGFGGRVDHCLSHILLLSRYPDTLLFETEWERMRIIRKSIQLRTKPNQMISLIPINGAVTGVKTEGLKWELDNQTFDKNFFGISNRALGSIVSIKIEKGDLLISEHC